MAKKKKVVEKVTRPKLTCKEDVIIYIENSPDELPFVEEVWEKAVEKAEANKKSAPPIITHTITDENGNTTSKKIVKGVKSTDPVSVYWSYMNLPQYKKKAYQILEEEQLQERTQEIMDVYFDEEEDEESSTYNEIVAWINIFPLKDERDYLKQRYAHYYDNYEINDGADRTMLSGILSLEIELHRINIKRAKGQAIDISREEKLRKMLRESLEAQKWTKKQRSALDEMGQNAFTIWMEKQSKNGRFVPEHHEISKDEIDFLMDTIPEAMRKMFD